MFKTQVQGSVLRGYLVEVCSEGGLNVCVLAAAHTPFPAVGPSRASWPPGFPSQGQVSGLILSRLTQETVAPQSFRGPAPQPLRTARPNGLFPMHSL